MFISSLILDGFKSYASRTILSHFDPHFNAITGLNGTGKSNLLDALCFVLGLTSLSPVRVSSFQELIYKNGQSRVTKASVTVVLDNREKEKSPVGYEDKEEITVCRQVGVF